MSNGCGGRGSRWSKPTAPPKVQQTFSQCPGQGQPMLLPGSQRPLPAAHQPGRSCHLPGGLGKLGSRVWDNLQTLQSCSKACSCRGWSSLGLSGFHYVTLSPSRSLSFFLAQEGCPACTAALSPHSSACPQEAESEGPPRSGCHDISMGGGLCRVPAAQREAGQGVCLSCAVTSVGPRLGHPTGPQLPPVTCSNGTCPLSSRQETTY